MENKKDLNATKDNKTKKMPVNNDQLGENASEEFKSEEYSNTMYHDETNKQWK